VKEYRAMFKNSGQLPKSSAYDDDEEREEYGQMKKPTGIFCRKKQNSNA
jgi:ATP-dependent Clp protease ATP-binding subunit ClpC